MTTITRTLEFQIAENTEHGIAGWAVAEMPGFDPISTEKSQYNNVDYWSRVLTHDIIEHDPNIAVGTIANEWAAFGALWIGRVEDDCIVTHDQFENDVMGLLETINSHFSEFDSTSDHDDLITELDNHIGLPDGDFTICDYMRNIITPWIVGHSCDYFTGGDRFCSELIERVLGWMSIGADTFTRRFAGSDYGGIFERVQWQIRHIFGSPNDVLAATGHDDTGVCLDEFWNEFTVILTIDTDSLEVSAALDYSTAYELGKMLPDEEDDDDQDGEDD